MRSDRYKEDVEELNEELIKEEPDKEEELDREERIDAVIKKILASKEDAIRFMQSAGIYDASGHLAKMYQ